jgi:ring-1,2-phenylacetyl-CoA epoxidase subunit PaaC
MHQIPNSQYLQSYLLHLADNSLILGQRNAEWCGHGPVLEQDIAITNISLDLIGQARNFYQYAANLIGNHATEDSLAYLRTEREFKNCLLVEQPNGDWAQTILRQFLFSNYQYFLFEELKNNADVQLAAIALKSLKETTYHVRWSSDWVLRLGDGTEESNKRINNALINLWPYTGELFISAEYENDLPFDVDELKQKWTDKISSIFKEATLNIPENIFMHSGGKNGIHTEHLGYILTELQYLQRTYPGVEW